jgi:hypothetical protein
MYDEFSKKGTVTWIAYPASSDWERLKSLFDELDIDFTPHKCECISTLLTAYAAQKGISKEAAGKELGFVNENPHLPEYDALAQGHLYFRLCNHFGIKLD